MDVPPTYQDTLEGFSWPLRSVSAQFVEKITAYDPQLIIVSKSKEAGFSDAQLKLGSFLKVPRRC